MGQGKDLASLQDEVAKLRQMLAGLEEMAQKGLPVAEAQALARAQLAQLTERLAPLGEVVRRSTAVDLRKQQVDTQVNVAHLYQVYQAPPGRADLSEAEFQRVLDDYLGWVGREYGYTRLHGLQSLQDSGALDRPLARVYTSLLVRHRPAVVPGGEARIGPAGALVRQMEDERSLEDSVDMADLLTLGERLAIVGGAGSGKTTYLAFVAASLSAALRGSKLDVRLKPPAPNTPLPVPLLAPLRFWQVYRQECSRVPGLRVRYGPDAGSLGAFLLWFLRARYKNFDVAGDFFERLLRGGRGCLILLDGLDEVVNVTERRTVRDEVDRLLRSQYPGNRCIVTARAAGYRDAPFGSEFVRCDIQPMTEEHISFLVTAWCAQIYPQPGDQEAACADLSSAIGVLNSEREAKGQAPLVATPLMVSMVVSVKYSRRELPRERAKLYDACVDVVLKSEYTGREDDAGARQGVVNAGGPPDKQREWLSLLAFHMHRGGQAGASLDEAGVRAILEPALRERGELDLLEPFLRATRHRGGLFEERGDRFQFVHLTFQEYLAAQHLAQQWREQGAGFLAQIAANEWWIEALLLTVGSLGSPAPYKQRQAFLAALCELAGPMDARLVAARLAATGLLDLADPEPVLLDLTRERLVTLLSAPDLARGSPAARADAGDALARLGDPRPGVGVRGDGLPDVTWCDVPGGPFVMGEAGSEDAGPEHTLSLPAFRIARYPVTNGQYAAFVRDGGYTERWRSCWADAGWHHKGDQSGPYTRGGVYDLPNHPAVMLSWYEALAFCRWLTARLRQAGELGAGEEVTLPSEAQWEKAARGTEGRVYPWGADADPLLANVDESGIGMTSAVGIFPGGASPYGCLDVVGNVWEWTRSLYGIWTGGKFDPAFGYPYDANDGREDPTVGNDGWRVLRGSAYYTEASAAGCAVRYRDTPNFRGRYGGFRIVVSPISRSGL